MFLKGYINIFLGFSVTIFSYFNNHLLQQPKEAQRLYSGDFFRCFICFRKRSFFNASSFIKKYTVGYVEYNAQEFHADADSFFTNRGLLISEVFLKTVELLKKVIIIKF